ncbi:hypothetical protein FIBSPDRAFT_689380, partial [Athelia psychrophila]
TLNCLLYGDKTTFTIRIASTATVEGLKVAIKDRTPLALAHIDPMDLCLWKVSIAVDSQLNTTVKAYAYEEEEALNGVMKVSNVFGDSLDGYLHILVR